MDEGRGDAGGGCEGGDFGVVDVEAVAEGQELGFGGLLGELVDEGDGELGVDGGGVGVAGGGGLVDFFVGALAVIAAGEGDGGEGALDGGVGGTDGAGEGVEEGTEVVAEIGPGDQEVRLGAVPVIGHDVVEGEEGAGGRRSVVVPDMGVVGIGTEARSAFRDDAILRRCGQVCFGGEDFGASFSRLIRDGGDDPGVVAGSIEEAVEFANVGGGESIVVVYDDVESDGGEGEDGEEGGQGVDGWKTHVEGKEMLRVQRSRDKSKGKGQIVKSDD